MSKLNLERKAEIVAHYMNTSDGYKNTAKKFGISDSTVERLVAQFKTNGIKGLTQKNGTYSGKFKLYVLKYQKHNNLSDKETAVYFKIPSIGTISVWRMKYLKGGYELLCRDGRGKPKNMATKKTKKNGKIHESIKGRRRRGRNHCGFINRGGAYRKIQGEENRPSNNY